MIQIHRTTDTHVIVRAAALQIHVRSSRIPVEAETSVGHTHTGTENSHRFVIPVQLAAVDVCTAFKIGFWRETNTEHARRTE